MSNIKIVSCGRDTTLWIRNIYYSNFIFSRVMANTKSPCSYSVPCRDETITRRKVVRGREQISHDALPRDVAYSYKPPACYAKGYRILPAYKREFDFTEMRKLLFLEDPEKVKKWGILKSRLPYPENRLIDLPGTRDSHYKNYCLRSLTPESAMSWRKSITIPAEEKFKFLWNHANEEVRFRTYPLNQKNIKIFPNPMKTADRAVCVRTFSFKIRTRAFAFIFNVSPFLYLSPTFPPYFSYPFIPTTMEYYQLRNSSSFNPSVSL